MKDQIKTYWNQQPCNVKHSQKSPKTPEYWQEVTAKKYRAEPHILPFADHVKYAGKRVLEVGCGIGTDAEQFARGGADYVGIDFSDISVDLCRKRFDVLNLPGSFLVADVENLLSYSLGEFDLVYSWGVLHHTPNIISAIEGIYDSLKPGGEFKMMVYATNSWKRILIDANFAQPEAQNNCPLANTYSETEIRDLLWQFTNVSITQDHIFPWQIEPYKRNEWIMEPWFSAMPPEMFSVLEKSLGWHLMVSATRA